MYLFFDKISDLPHVLHVPHILHCRSSHKQVHYERRERDIVLERFREYLLSILLALGFQADNCKWCFEIEIPIRHPRKNCRSMTPGLKVGSHARASVETANVEKVFIIGKGRKR